MGWKGKTQIITLFVFGIAGCGKEPQHVSNNVSPPPPLVPADNPPPKPQEQDLPEGSQIEELASRAVELKITVPPKSKEAPRLAVYLHGDTAWEHNADGRPDGRGGRQNTLRALKNFAVTHNAVFVSARSPNGRSWWTDDGRRFADHSAELDHALESVIQRYGVKRDRFFFGGVSGGSTFASAEFLPRFGAKYPGVYALMCGGARRYRDFRALDRSALKIFFNFGDRDFLYRIIRPAAALYRASGFLVRETIYRGIAHCRFSTQDVIASLWGWAQAN